MAVRLYKNEKKLDSTLDKDSKTFSCRDYKLFRNWDKSKRWLLEDNNGQKPLVEFAAFRQSQIKKSKQLATGLFFECIDWSKSSFFCCLITGKAWLKAKNGKLWMDRSTLVSGINGGIARWMASQSRTIHSRGNFGYYSENSSRITGSDLFQTVYLRPKCAGMLGFDDSWLVELIDLGKSRIIPFDTFKVKRVKEKSSWVTYMTSYNKPVQDIWEKHSPEREAQLMLGRWADNRSKADLFWFYKGEPFPCLFRFPWDQSDFQACRWKNGSNWKTKFPLVIRPFFPFPIKMLGLVFGCGAGKPAGKKEWKMPWLWSMTKWVGGAISYKTIEMNWFANFQSRKMMRGLRAAFGRYL